MIYTVEGIGNIRKYLSEGTRLSLPEWDDTTYIVASPFGGIHKIDRLAGTKEPYEGNINDIWIIKDQINFYDLCLFKDEDDSNVLHSIDLLINNPEFELQVDGIKDLCLYRSEGHKHVLILGRPQRNLSLSPKTTEDDANHFMRGITEGFLNLLTERANSWNHIERLIKRIGLQATRNKWKYDKRVKVDQSGELVFYQVRTDKNAPLALTQEDRNARDWMWLDNRNDIINNQRDNFTFQAFDFAEMYLNYRLQKEGHPDLAKIIKKLK